MFHFPGCPPHELWIHSWVTRHYPGRVSPFGDLRIKAYLRLPEAFRSLSRPSSAISALASTLRSSSLDLAYLLLLPKTSAFAVDGRSKPLCSVSAASSQYLYRSSASTGHFSLSLFVSSLCSFQGALKARMNLDSALRLPLDLSDPSKRYRNHHHTTAKSLVEQLALFYSAGLAPACRSFRLLLRLRSSLQRSRVSVPTSSFDLGL